MKFSYSAVWDDTVVLLRGHASLLLAVAGVFLFLPALLSGHFIPQPAVEPKQLTEVMRAYFAANWHWVLLANLINMVGALAMFQLLLGPRGHTVGAAIAAAVPPLPVYLAATILSALFVVAILVILLLPIVLLAGPSATSGPLAGVFPLLMALPAAYLFARLAVTLGPIVIAEERRGPLRALRRSFALTRSYGWAVLGLVLAVVLAGAIVDFALTKLLGTLFLLVAGAGVGAMLVLILEFAAAAILSTVVVVLFAAIYRRLLLRDAPISGS